MDRLKYIGWVAVITICMGISTILCNKAVFTEALGDGGVICVLLGLIMGGLGALCILVNPKNGEI